MVSPDIDELSVLTASGERIAARMETNLERGPASPQRNTAMADMALPSNSIMSRLDNMRVSQ